MLDEAGIGVEEIARQHDHVGIDGVGTLHHARQARAFEPVSDVKVADLYDAQARELGGEPGERNP